MATQMQLASFVTAWRLLRGLRLGLGLHLAHKVTVLRVRELLTQE